MQILVRQYVPNRDKTNTPVDSIDKALKILGKEFKEAYLFIEINNHVQIFFIGTKDYLVVTN